MNKEATEIAEVLPHGFAIAYEPLREPSVSTPPNRTWGGNPLQRKPFVASVSSL